MRFALVPFVLLVCSSALAATPTATTDSSADYFKIDMTRPPAPPTNVNVLNFPDVQAVGGTVNVGNLPLDADGAVRVTSAPARQTVWYELLDAPITVYSATLPTVVNVDGYSRVGVLVTATDYAERLRVDLYSRWNADEEFRAVADSRIGSDAMGAIPCSGYASTRLLCPTSGGDLKVSVNNTWGYLTTITSVRVYLFP